MAWNLGRLRACVLEAVPLDGLDSLAGSNIPDFYYVFVSVASSNYCVAVALEVNCIAANVRAIDACYWSTLSDVVDLKRIVPATRADDVAIERIELESKHSVGVAWEVIAILFHFDDECLGLFVVKANEFIFSHSSQ